MDYNSFEESNIEYLVNIIKRFNVNNIADLLTILQSQYQSVFNFIAENNEKIKFLIESNNVNIHQNNNNFQNINQHSNIKTNNTHENKAHSYDYPLNITGCITNNQEDKFLEVYYYNNKGSKIFK